MDHADYIYKETFKRCLEAGVKNNIAANAASHGLRKYKTNQFKKVSDLISQQVKDAKAGRL